MSSLNLFIFFLDEWGLRLLLLLRTNEPPVGLGWRHWPWSLLYMHGEGGELARPKPLPLPLSLPLSSSHLPHCFL